jgi:hypothetical protein
MSAPCYVLHGFLHRERLRGTSLPLPEPRRITPTQSVDEGSANRTLNGHIPSKDTLGEELTPLTA